MVNVLLYNGHWIFNIVPGGVLQTQFLLPANNREIRLKTVSWDFNCGGIGGMNIHPDENTVLYKSLQVGAFGNTLLGNPFELVAGNVFLSGATIFIYTTGQYHFENLRTSNNIPFQVRIDNLDLLVNMPITMDICAEIEVL
jgi:hypothetical protein